MNKTNAIKLNQTEIQNIYVYNYNPTGKLFNVRHGWRITLANTIDYYNIDIKNHFD